MTEDNQIQRINSNCMNNCLTYKRKRYFLPLALLCPITFTYSDVFLLDYISVPLMSGFVGFVIFWNFPVLIYMTSEKPLYYEDIFIDHSRIPIYQINPNIKNKYKCILLWVLILSHSILVAALSDYWLYKIFLGKTYEFTQILGITGGIIQIFQIVNYIICTVILMCIQHEVKLASIKLHDIESQHINHILKLKSLDMVGSFMELTERNTIHQPAPTARSDIGHSVVNDPRPVV
jgi:hypothetical protein